MRQFLFHCAIYSSLSLCFAGVPCNKIGKGTYTVNGVKHPQLDPFTPGQGFDIVQPGDCYHRFQHPRYHMPTGKEELGLAMDKSRMTNSKWQCTDDMYIATANHFYNVGGTNAQLWLTGIETPYQYAGLLLGSSMTGQTSRKNALDKPETVLTYLLPSGVSKVTTVHPGRDENSKRLSDLGGVGLRGTVDPSEDYAYASVFQVSLALGERYPNPEFRAFFEAEDQDPLYGRHRGAFVAAEKASKDGSPGDCVVIDYRKMPSYFRNVEGYPMVPVTECS